MSGEKRSSETYVTNSGEFSPKGESRIATGVPLRFDGGLKHKSNTAPARIGARGAILSKTKASRYIGKIYVTTRLEDDPRLETNSVTYSVHKNVVTGLLAYQRFQSHKTYVVHLKGIEETFGSYRAEWNKSHKRAQKIFGRSPAGMLIRKAIQWEHMSLYRKQTRLISQYASDVLLTGCDFLKLINYGVKKNAHCAYTYVVVDKGLYFSETGIMFSKDLLSKHAVHANAASSVRYAGEFYVQWRPKEGMGTKQTPCRNMGDYDWTLVVNNNSGTYAPQSGKPLEMMKSLLKRNFPDLELKVEAFDKGDAGALCHVKDKTGPECVPIWETLDKLTSKEKRKYTEQRDKYKLESLIASGLVD